MKVAWRTTVMGITSIVAAESRAQAVALTMRSIVEANYQGVKWTDVKARRASEHDQWAELDATRCCWSEEYLPAAAER